MTDRFEQIMKEAEESKKLAQETLRKLKANQEKSGESWRIGK